MLCLFRCSDGPAFMSKDDHNLEQTEPPDIMEPFRPFVHPFQSSMGAHWTSNMGYVNPLKF